MGIVHLVSRSLDTKVSPMVYIMAAVSVVIGFSYVFLTGLPDIENSLLYQSQVLIGFPIWGSLLCAGAIGTIIGLYKKSRVIIEPSAMICFMMWSFAAITHLWHLYFFAFLTYSLFHMMFYGYVYLASNLGFIERMARKHLETS